MTRHPHPDPSPFYLSGGPTGVLLIHGYTGAPPEMRLVGDSLHQRGLTVSGPLLPGHGTTPDDMNAQQWTAWTAHVQATLAELQARCETVFVGGLSMGALLTLCLAAHYPELPGIILYSPALRPANWRIHLTPLIKYVIPLKAKSGGSDLTDPEADLRLWSYEVDPLFAAHQLLKLIRQVRRLLPQVTCPALVLYSTLDQAIHPSSAPQTYERIGATDKELVTLHHSGHCITVDSEWQEVAQRTYAFICDHLGGPRVNTP
jgi:carboxylesterase